MNTQIYLMLIRDANFPFKKDRSSALKAAAQIPLLLKNFIQGDSLDLPFLRMIRVDSVENKISFPGVTTSYRPPGAVATTSGHDAGSYSDIKQARFRRQGKDDSEISARPRAPRDAPPPIPTAANSVRHAHAGNTFMKSHLPDHSDFVFTKQPDNATPQIAYGCSAQQIFPLAVFFFRRKIGVGVGGIRLPFMCIGLRKVRVVGWELGADLSETVTLKYADIAWTAVPPLADANIPGGLNVKDWDTEASKNLKGNWFGWTIQAITTAVVAAAGVATSMFGND